MTEFQRGVHAALSGCVSIADEIGESVPVYLAPRVAAAIEAVIEDAEAGGWRRREIAQALALEALRGESQP